MIKFKKLFLILAMSVFAAAGFVSCSNDDDDDNDDIVTYLVLKKAQENKIAEEKAALYGTYEGSMTVMKKTVPVTAEIAENSITLSSGYGAYEPAFWFKNSESKWVVAGRAKSNAETDVTADNCDDKTVCGVYISFGDSVEMTIPAMASMGGSCSLTKAE